MPSIHRDPKSKTFRIMFRYGGRQYQKSLKTTDQATAEMLKGKIELTLRELELGRRSLPEGADLWEYVESDGHRTGKAEAPRVVTLEHLFSRYESEMPPGTMEANSLATIRIHRNHLLRVLGPRVSVQSITTSVLQGYINERARAKYRGKTLSPRTIKKEITTLRSVWNWGKDHGIVSADPPTKGLKYEKEDKKPGFLTWEEIERRVGRGGLTDEQIADLWDAVFLSTEQIAECLEHVRTTSTIPFIYPMFVFVAHTGARRSEMIRSRVEDIDLAARRVCIREKKKDRTKKETERYVEMSPLLERVMRAWLGEQHPGGPHTFCHTEVVARSRKRSQTTGHQSGAGRATSLRGRQASLRPRADRPGHAPLTNNEATHHFKKVLEGSKWAVLRGFHVFRHSFASNMARKNVDQRLIDNYMGHQTEEMRKRYRHLFPQEKENAIRNVFGG
ncbi:MAG: site-specific recombinase XerD [Gemmataceae bacterium]|nr:site-specific recombinase XerD [Gemmataceae bacterium]